MRPWRAEGIGLSLGVEVTSQVLERAMERLSPSEEELTLFLQALPHVSAHVAHSLARVPLAVQVGSHGRHRATGRLLGTRSMSGARRPPLAGTEAGPHLGYNHLP